MTSKIEVFPDHKIIISIESAKDELESIIGSIEAVIDQLSISEGSPHIRNLSKLIDALKCQISIEGGDTI